MQAPKIKNAPSAVIAGVSFAPKGVAEFIV
jgi:hypothetical protein